MKVIAGLGNPGRRYSKTRHNLGFMVLDKLASTYGIKLNKKGFDSYWGEGFIEGEKVILTKPQTFMNLSGEAIRSILKGKGMETSDLVILHDDMDIELGKIRIKNRGGSGGHRGLKSIIDLIGTDRFIRIRLGIGGPKDKEEAEAYVLSPFKKSETPIISETILMAVQAAVTIVKDGVIEAMNKYNKRDSRNYDLI